MLSRTRKQKLEANIWKFYLYRVFASFTFVGPIFVLFLLDNGLSMTQVMILQSIYTAIIMLTVVPFGIVADYIGRRKILIAQAALFCAGWLIYALSYNFFWFVIAEIVLALCVGMWNSSAHAFFYDNLKELNREGSTKRLYGKVVGINNIAWAVAALIAGYVATYSLRLPFWLSVIPTFIALIITFSFTETKDYKHGEKHYLDHLKDAIRFAAKHPKVRLFIIYNAIIWGVMFSGFMMYQPYLKSLNLPLFFFGIVYAIMNIAAAIGGRFAHNLDEKLKEKKMLLLIAGLMILSYFGMSKVTAMIGLIFPILISFAAGVFEPTIMDYFNKHVESHHRATVNSLSNLATEGLATILAPFLGWMIDVYTLQAAFVVAGIITAINLFVLFVMYMVGRK